MNYLVLHQQQQVGPVDEPTLRSRLAAGEFLPDDPAWHEGLPGWQPLRQLFPDAVPEAGAPRGTGPVAALPVNLSPATTPAGGSGDGATGSRAQYLRFVRQHSAYPFFRSVIGIFTWATYIGAVVLCLVQLGFSIYLFKQAGAAAGLFGMLGAVISPALLALGGRVTQEVALMLADLADSTLHQNAHLTPLDPR